MSRAGGWHREIGKSAAFAVDGLEHHGHERPREAGKKAPHEKSGEIGIRDPAVQDPGARVEPRDELGFPCRDLGKGGIPRRLPVCVARRKRLDACPNLGESGRRLQRVQALSGGRKRLAKLRIDRRHRSKTRPGRACADRQPPAFAEWSGSPLRRNPTAARSAKSPPSTSCDPKRK